MFELRDSGCGHIGGLTFAGRDAIAGHLYPSFGVVAPAVTEADTAEFVRTYAQPGGFRGATGLYRSMLRDGDEINLGCLLYRVCFSPSKN